MFYHEVGAVIDKFLKAHAYIRKYLQYADFHIIEEISSDSYGTVYTARYKGIHDVPEIVALKHFKSYDEMPELFITEVNNH